MSLTLLDRLTRLQADECYVVEAIVTRLDQGRTTYGPWRVGDGRDNPHEALCEVSDALAYVAAELVRLSRSLPKTNCEELDKSNPESGVEPAVGITMEGSCNQ